MGSVDQLPFAEVVEAFAVLACEGEPASVDRAIERQAVERRLMEFLTTRSRDVEHRASIRVPGEAVVHILSGEQWMTGSLVDLGEGGLQVRTLLPLALGETVDVEIAPVSPAALLHVPRGRAVVAWARPHELAHDCGLTFVAYGEAERRHLRRVIVELLRLVAR